MAGWNTIQELRRIETEVNRLGFKFAGPKHAGHWGDPGHQDMVSIVPKDDCLPVYTREAEIFTGTLSDVRTWLRGVEWARNYDMLHKISDDKKRAKKEDDFRQRDMLKKLAGEAQETKIDKLPKGTK
jgi:hypothetical protein